jgi:hypothetical protein
MTTQIAYQRKKERDDRRRFERESWGLQLEQRHAASCFSVDVLDLLLTAARQGGLEVAEAGLGAELAKLTRHHFLTVEPGPEGRAVAKVTRAGLAAILLRKMQAVRP